MRFCVSGSLLASHSSGTVTICAKAENSSEGTHAPVTLLLLLLLLLVLLLLFIPTLLLLLLLLLLNALPPPTLLLLHPLCAPLFQLPLSLRQLLLL